MMKIGPVKPMAVMSASGILGSAVNHRHSPTVWARPRLNWSRMFRGMKLAAPPRQTNGRITSRPKKYRRNCA
jgi:hypothetical protein